MATCYPAYELPPPQPPPRPVQVPPVPKDYSRPLHVDCSVEYELPNAAKPPQGVRNEPLLMIHPCYFRKIESQRRSPFVNNLPPAAAPKRRRPPQQCPYWEPQCAPVYCGEPERSPDRPEVDKQQQQHIFVGKYRQYLRNHHHRLHPYVGAGIPIASTFPQIQQVCYNV